MALTWKFDEKKGEVELANGQVIDLYEGNAYLIGIMNLPEDQYTLAFFATDRRHFQNCLGINKGYTENIYAREGQNNWKKIKIDKNWTGGTNIVQDIMKAKMQITIEIY